MTCVAHITVRYFLPRGGLRRCLQPIDFAHAACSAAIWMRRPLILIAVQHAAVFCGGAAVVCGGSKNSMEATCGGLRRMG